MRVDSSSKFVQNKNVLEYYNELFRKCEKEEVVAQLKGLVIMTPYNNKFYRIEDILFEKNCSDTFKTHKDE